MSDLPTPKRTLWARLRKRWALAYVITWVAILTAEVVLLLVYVSILEFFVPGVLRLIQEHGQWEELLPIVKFLVIGTTCFSLFFLLIVEWGFRQRIRRNLCTHCRYDLRASIELERTECPECGYHIERLT